MYGSRALWRVTVEMMYTFRVIFPSCNKDQSHLILKTVCSSVWFQIVSQKEQKCSRLEENTIAPPVFSAKTVELYGLRHRQSKWLKSRTFRITCHCPANSDNSYTSETRKSSARTSFCSCFSGEPSTDSLCLDQVKDLILNLKLMNNHIFKQEAYPARQT